MNLHLHLAGKTGELLYASGAFPAIRKRWPESRLILHLHPHYAPVVDGLRYQPDEVRLYPVANPGAPLWAQVRKCLHEVNSRQGLFPIAMDHSGDWHCLLYGMHAWCDARPAVCQPAPFWNLFRRAADAMAFPYARPGWASPAGVMRPRVALVFPVTDADCGAFRKIDIGQDAWGRIARELGDVGLIPTACAHGDDGRPGMPGWRWLETDSVVDVLATLERADRVLGCNSGIVFAACAIAPGRVTMIDGQRRREYLFPAMHEEGILNPARHFQVDWTDAVAGPERETETGRAALEMVVRKALLP